MSDKLIIPGAIIIAGLIIGGAIYLGGGSQSNMPEGENTTTNQTVNARVVTEDEDHILGSSDAEIFVVEYSDLECPFCKRYHDNALAQLKANYADNDNVAFVFRHFPLDQPYTSQALHPTATEEAIAAECVATLGGDEAFFTFVDAIFASTASNGQYDLSRLPALAVEAGVSRDAFNTCYDNRDTEPIVSRDFQDGINAGVQGTPTIFIQTADGKTYPAVADYNALKIAIDAYLADKQ